MKLNFSWKSIVETIEGSKSETFWEGDREIVRFTGPKPGRVALVSIGLFGVLLFATPIVIIRDELFTLNGICMTIFFSGMVVFMACITYKHFTFKQAQFILLTPEGAHRLLADGEREFAAWEEVLDIRIPFDNGRAPFVFYMDDGREILLGYSRVAAPQSQIVTAYLKEWCGLGDFLDKAQKQVGTLRRLILAPLLLGFGSLLWTFEHVGWSGDQLTPVAFIGLMLVVCIGYFSERYFNRKRRELFASSGGVRLKINDLEQVR